MSGATAGFEVSQRRDELALIITEIMNAHSERKGCTWKSGAVDSILCDLKEAIERQEICMVKDAA